MTSRARLGFRAARAFLSSFIVTSALVVFTLGHFRVTRVRDIQSTPKRFPFPKVLHQMHRSRDALSPLELLLTERCKAVNADFEYRFWDDAAMDAFVASTYPQHHEWWKAMTPVIKKVDTSRYFLMHHFGGVYVDVDVDCIRPVSEVAAALPRGTAWNGGYPECFQLMSDAHHAFWPWMIDRIHATLENADAWTSTGPSGLNDALAAYVERRGKDVLIPWRTYDTTPGWLEFAANEGNMSVPWFVDNFKKPDDGRLDGRGVCVGFWPNQVVDPGACAESKQCANDTCATRWPYALFAHRCTGTWRV